MNTYYELIKHIKTIFEQDVLVNTVTTEDNPTVIDNYKKNIYPLVHIAVTSAPFLDKLNLAYSRFVVEINVLDVRDNNKEEVNDKFWKNDNRHDNLNTTYAILKKARDRMVKDRLGTDITLVTSDAAIPNIYAFSNVLDGWTQNWTMDVPDELTNVCESF